MKREEREHLKAGALATEYKVAFEQVLEGIREGKWGEYHLRTLRKALTAYVRMGPPVTLLDLELPVALYRRLNTAGYTDIKDVTSVTDGRVARDAGLRQSDLAELHKILDDNGLAFRRPSSRRVSA